MLQNREKLLQLARQKTTSSKYTVITGASSGIGYETAKIFAECNSNLILTARRKSRLENLKQEILTLFPATDIIIKPLDLSVPENVFKFYNEVKNYPLQTWINNAGFGNYDSVGNQDLNKICQMVNLNVTALTILSSLFVRDFKDIEGTQLINVSSCGGYIIVPDAITYCASKFYTSAFTEGLAKELKKASAKMQAKVFAPAATKTGFGKIANNVTEYNYDKNFKNYHTSRQAAEFLLELYNSDKTAGIVDRETFSFALCDPQFRYAGNPEHNQKIY